VLPNSVWQPANLVIGDPSENRSEENREVRARWKLNPTLAKMIWVSEQIALV
jgi:hypothetical protein